MRRKTVEVSRKIADEYNAVISIKTDNGNNEPLYRREPCPGCPWRIKNNGMFPAQAYRLSAACAYDASFHTFACHESGQKNPATCAGFLLQNSVHNVTIRIQKSKFGPFQVKRNRARLHKSYRAMAIANGVSPDDLAIAPCRADSE